MPLEALTCLLDLCGCEVVLSVDSWLLPLLVSLLPEARGEEESHCSQKALLLSRLDWDVVDPRGEGRLGRLCLRLLLPTPSSAVGLGSELWLSQAFDSLRAASGLLFKAVSHVESLVNLKLLEWLPSLTFRTKLLTRGLPL